MGRPNHDSLLMPANRYRLDLHMTGFETIEDAQLEDSRRANLLDSSLAALVLNEPLDAKTDKRVSKLSHKLRHSVSGIPLETPASKLYMRDYRIRWYGHLWRLIVELDQPVATFTIIKRNWVRFPEDLDEPNPLNLGGQLRGALNRCGAGESSGFLYASLDGEYMPQLQSYQVHYHGVATGEKIAVVDRLRELRSFVPWQSDGRVRGCSKPVQLSRAELTNLPGSIAYADKGYWQSKINGRTMRVPEPHHSQVLMMLSRYRIQELTLRMNLGVKDGELQLGR